MVASPLQNFFSPNQLNFSPSQLTPSGILHILFTYVIPVCLPLFYEDRHVYFFGSLLFP